jgi:hypothetical protein
LRDSVALSPLIFGITSSLLLYTTSVFLILLRYFSPYISAPTLLLEEDIGLRKRVGELSRHSLTVS